MRTQEPEKPQEPPEPQNAARDPEGKCEVSDDAPQPPCGGPFGHEPPTC